MKNLLFLAFVCFSLWTSVSVFSQNDLFSDISVEMKENVPIEEYDFEPDEGSPGVEVAPLPVNSQDKDVPYYVPTKNSVSNSAAGGSQSEE